MAKKIKGTLVGVDLDGDLQEGGIPFYSISTKFGTHSIVAGPFVGNDAEGTRRFIQYGMEKGGTFTIEYAFRIPILNILIGAKLSQDS